MNVILTYFICACIIEIKCKKKKNRIVGRGTRGGICDAIAINWLCQYYSGCGPVSPVVALEYYRIKYNKDKKN